ncbi:MAG: RND family efflux transporter MFP subunit [Patiriisocius sp.]|jgi:RND family efflux transporter MFP subunit
MHHLFSKRNLTIAVALLAILIAASLLTNVIKTNEPDWVTSTVEYGNVQQAISVSGFIEAKNTAELSFPSTGVVTDVFVDQGSVVRKGDLLATLGSQRLVALRSEAVAALTKAQAARSELVAGPTSEERSVTETSVRTAQATLDKTVLTEAKKVANAKASMLSSNLEVLSEKGNEDATAPTVTGTYTCDEMGSYTLDVYSSSQSGFSYQLGGLEQGSYAASTKQPTRLGVCGLFIEFAENSTYINSNWIIAIPNTNSSNYLINENAYNLALTQEAQLVQAATDALSFASNSQTAANAGPRSESLTQAAASVDGARAQIASIDAQIADLSIVAPFDGVITDVTVLPGETAGATPVITLLAEDAFELTARIPEIDITKIATEQSAEIVFDAKSDEILTGTVTYISPLATEIDGVAYFETTITLNDEPTWIRSGLNADIEIIVQQESDALRIPRRFVTENDDGSYTVLTEQNGTLASTTVEVQYIGNNGYVSVLGLSEGSTVIAP